MRGARAGRLAVIANVTTHPFRRIANAGCGASCLQPCRFSDKTFGQLLVINLLLGQLFDIAQIAFFVIGAKGDGDAARSGARGTADPVDILLSDIG